jgi:hypothetical protein
MEYPNGWTCELVVVKLELYLTGSLPLDDSLSVAEHLEACPGCAHSLVLRRLTVRRTEQGSRRG